MGAGGGLLVVMDLVDGDTERIAEQISETVPVALIDTRTLNGLQRLGQAFPIGETKTYYEASPGDRAEPVSPLVSLAHEKLKAAEVLIEQQCTAAAMELLCSGLLAAAASRAGIEYPSSPRKAGVWLYGDVIPKGLLTQKQGMAIMRAVSLAEAPVVRVNLIRETLEDAREFVESGAAKTGNSIY